MEKIVLSLLFALSIVFILGTIAYYVYSNKFGTKGLLSRFQQESSHMLKVEKLKSQVEFHLNWARHSGDKDRVQALESELLNLNLSITELTVTPN